jgi:methionine biosynthesis protein MetW
MANHDNFNLSYIGERKDILELIPGNVKKVLDLGCSIGTLGEQIKNRSHAEVVGLEIDHEMAMAARKKIDKVIVGNIEEIDLNNYLSNGYFDCIIMADILEHLINPWEVLKKLVEFMSDGGIIIASIPNIRHYSTIVSLVCKGYWPYEDRGIHDKTHLRFFTFKNIKEMFSISGLRVLNVKRNYRIVERPSRINRLSKFFAIFPFKDLLTFQYIVVAKRK